jgi:hypothetical protein
MPLSATIRPASGHWQHGAQSGGGVAAKPLSGPVSRLDFDRLTAKTDAVKNWKILAAI